MRYTFDPRRSKYFRSSNYNNNVYSRDRQLFLNTPYDFTDDEKEAVESLYPGCLEPFEEVEEANTPDGANTPPPGGKGGKGKSKPTTAQRNQVIDQLKSENLDQAMLESVLNDYPDDAEIMSLVETAMSGVAQ